MNLVVPVNLQALRVTPNDASLITKRGDFFGGPTVSFEQLPWRDANYTEHAGRVSKANVSDNVNNPFTGGVTQQLDAGVHLHWALPDALTRSVQQPDGTLVFPPAPNRWLVTRILQRAGQAQPQARQWIVESDHLMTEEAYTAQYATTRRKAGTLPVGWTLMAGNDPQKDGGALYYPPSRRLGRVFELHAWQPAATAANTPPDQVLHLDELQRQAHAFAKSSPPAPLKAVGATGPGFAAYYPDCRSAFGFHDLFDDLGAGFDLNKAAFQVSYVVIGWHSHAGDDPLGSGRFNDALTKAAAANANAPIAMQVDAPTLAANTVLDTYRWHYDAHTGTPGRCLYNGQVAGLLWDTTAGLPGGDPQYPNCYLQPLGDDPSVRMSVGCSPSSAMAALIKREWTDWIGSGGTPGQGQAPGVPDEVERDLEFLIDALQLGLLHGLGTAASLPQLEQAVHQSGFGARQGGRLWTVQAKPTPADKADPQRFAAPQAQLPAGTGELAGKLATLNACQQRLDALLDTVDSCRRQIFLDWYHYMAAVGSVQANGDTDALKEALKTYISGQVVDLWAKLDAAFGTKTQAAPATGNVPVFFSTADSYLTLKDDGSYTSASPLPSLAGQVAAAANAVLAVVKQADYDGFELRQTEQPRFWLPNEPVVVATGDSLRPAQRNGTAKYLPCRLSPQLVGVLQATAGAANASASAAAAVAALSLGVPQLAANQTPEAADTQPLLDDVKALLGESCLLDATLAPVLAGQLAAIHDAALATNLQASLRDVAGQITRAWEAGAPSNAAMPMPAILGNLSATAGTLQITLQGQAPQGAGLTAQSAGTWQDPFLPLFLVWELSYRPFEKGAGVAAPDYLTSFVTHNFQLDEGSIDLVPAGPGPATQPGSMALQGFIPLSSRAGDPLLDQIRQYVELYPQENPQLQAVTDYMKNKPLLSQGLSGINPALLSRAQGMQLAVFNPFYDAEAPATALGAGTNTLDYANVLTHFVGWAAGALADQVPLAGVGFNPLRSGYLTVARADVVDAFGRKRRVIDGSLAADAAKVVVCSQWRAPAGAPGQVSLPPRLAEPARLVFEWIQGNDGRVATNADPSTSPVTGWVVQNHIDNSLMLFRPSGEPLGSLAVAGGQASVTWLPAPGHAARSMQEDMAGPDLVHFLKFATFIHGKDRAFFNALMDSISGAHTYIVADNARGEEPYAVLMGRPLALVRADLRLEAQGLPAVDPGLDAVRAAMAANGTAAYDWTLRRDAGLRNVDFPVRLGDRNQLADGLVAYLLDDDQPYDTLYAPAAAAGDGTGVRRPAADTLKLQLRPALDAPATAYPDAATQTAALRDATARPAARAVTLLMDPRASVHATTGILPAKRIDLPAATYDQALQSIEVTFFTHPVLRSAQGMELPVPQEAGFDWRWTTSVTEGQVTTPNDEALTAAASGDRASFRFSPQVAQDGWLKLVPKPSQPKH